MARVKASISPAVIVCAGFLSSIAVNSEVALPGIFNSPENDLAITLSARTGEAWLERRGGNWGKGSEPSRILYLTLAASGEWSLPSTFEPVMADGDAGEPFYDETSDTLYFTTTRRHPELGDSQSNIWRIRRREGQWGLPQPLPAPVNSAGVEYSPMLAGDSLYFASYRGGQGDLYKASKSGDIWRVTPLGPAINSPTGEWNLWVSADESLLVFEASERASNVSVPGDLYVSVKDDAGHWLPAAPLRALNGSGSELNARVAGKSLLYASSTHAVTHTDLHEAPVSELTNTIAKAWGYRLAVVSRSSHRLSTVNLRSGRPVQQWDIGPGPHLVASQEQRMAVAAYGEYPRPHSGPVTEMPGWVAEDGGSILLVGEAPGAVIEVCNRPHGSAFDDRAERLWVSCEDRQGVVEIDLRSQPPAQRLIKTHRAGAHVVAWDSDRDQLLVAHTGGGGVAFVKTDSGESEFLQLASGAEAIHIDPARGEAWVSLGPSAALSIIDLERRSEIARLVPGCDFPIDFAMTQSGELWVACFGSSEVIALAPATREVVDRLSLPSGPLNIVAHPELPVLYASLPRQNRVVEISLTGRGITRAFEAGMEPDGLAIQPLPARTSPADPLVR